MAVGFGILRLPPRQFWSMTPRELRAALTIVNGGGIALPLDRRGLVSLMKRFPDVATSQEKKRG
ncbi:MAG: rcc01693 family protein [Hyphomicrobiaceae bacterium]